jgi:hypothetical protein
VVRVAALVEGVRVNIHRARPSAAEEPGDTGVKVHRGGGGGNAAPAVAVHVGEPPVAVASAAAAEVVAATE